MTNLNGYKEFIEAIARAELLLEKLNKETKKEKEGE